MRANTITPMTTIAKSFPEKSPFIIEVILLTMPLTTYTMRLSLTQIRCKALKGYLLITF